MLVARVDARSPRRKMRAFEYIAARDSRHAVALLAEHGAAARILAGGTDLLVELKGAARVPRMVIDISRVAELQQIALTAQGLSIGAAVTHAAIMQSPLVREFCPVLIDAAHTIGAAQTRNLGTLGGNLVTCVPSLDSGPALAALDAMITISGPGGDKTIPLAEFFVGPRKTILHADELLAAIVIPQKNLGKPAAFLKFGLRKGQALALVNVAVSAHIDGGDNPHFRDTRIALGAVAPQVMRATHAETYLEGRAVTPAATREAGAIAAGEAQPISDFRASAGYRRDLVAALTRRALEKLCMPADARPKER
jgi:CO/xanthine dehydrogenase FAD-binding subunit